MKTRVVVLAGGEGSRLGVLTAKRAKPAVPFAGKYRIVDFALSNCVNSGLFDIMMLTQWRPHSLIEHIGAGRPWDLDRSFTGGIRIHQPYKGRADTDWYAGTADAIQQNFGFLKHGDPDLVLVLGGDHIYQMNYDPMIAFHRDHQADLTIASRVVTRDEATRMGILATDDHYRVTQFVEKPRNPPGNLASMGLYVFSLPVLDRLLREDAARDDSSHDFGKDIIPHMVRSGMRVFTYPYGGYWMDVGTLESYWLAHMDLLKHPPAFDLNDRSWVIHTRSAERPPVLIQSGASVRDSLICDGCVIAPGASVERSVLSPGVYVGPNVQVRDSVILNDTWVEAGARVERAVVDKNVIIGHNAQVGRLIPGDPNLAISSVGKNITIPSGTRVERGATINPDIPPDHIPRDGVGEGEVLTKPPL